MQILLASTPQIDCSVFYLDTNGTLSYETFGIFKFFSFDL